MTAFLRPFNIASMARQARIVLPDTPHHIMQKSMEDAQIFNEKQDFQTYCEILKAQCEKADVMILSYCLMPNQIHLLLMPQSERALSSAIGETHRQYTKHRNEKSSSEGTFFQNRFYSYPMDEPCLLKAASFIENLPTMAKIAPAPENYIWSSACAHIKGRADRVMDHKPLLHIIPEWKEFIALGLPQSEMDDIQAHLSTGRPRGSEMFLDAVEEMIGRPVRAGQRGRKPKDQKAA